MKINQLISVTTLLIIGSIITSCGDNLPSVIKTSSGLYGSKEGEFLAGFPGKPFVFSEHYQLGSTEFDNYSFQYRVANENIYNVTYVDFPSDILKSWDTEQLFDQTMATLSSQVAQLKIVKKEVVPDSKYDNCINYTLGTYDTTNDTFVKARLIRTGGRIYYIYFASLRRHPGNETVENFLNSFKVYVAK
jgi:hypothetical protein